MNGSVNIFKPITIVGLPLAIFFTLFLLIKSPTFHSNPSVLSLAITLDLLLTIPIVYFLLIRKTSISKSTIVIIMFAGLAFGSYFLPENNQNYLNLFKLWILPLIEITIIIYSSVKVRKAIKKYKSLKIVHVDFYSALKDTCYEIFPKNLALLVATEIAVLYYGFLNLKTRTLKDNEFSYHKKSVAPALFGAFILIISVETFAFHLLFLKWSVIAAWVFSGISIYTALQIFGIARSLSKRPIIIANDRLKLRYGILNETDIILQDIESIILSRKSIQQYKTARKLSPLGELESHNVVITLKNEHTLTGLYGMQKKFKILALHVDNEREFKENLEFDIKQCLLS